MDTVLKHLVVDSSRKPHTAAGVLGESYSKSCSSFERQLGGQCDPVH